LARSRKKLSENIKGLKKAGIEGFRDWEE